MNNRGAALMLAIFMIIVFGIIGAAIVTMLTTSSITSSEDLISSQAFFMAESGGEIRIKQFLDDPTNSTDNKTYSYNNFTITTELNIVKTINHVSNTRVFSILTSTATEDNIRRAITVKFWK